MMESMLNPQDLPGQTSVQKRCLGKKLHLSYQSLKDLLPSRPLLVDMEIWGTEVRVMYTTVCFRNLHKTLTLKNLRGAVGIRDFNSCLELDVQHLRMNIEVQYIASMLFVAYKRA